MSQTTRCLSCRKPVADHAKYTQADVDASQGATFKAPVNGYLCPLSSSLIGVYKGHDPVLLRNDFNRPVEIELDLTAPPMTATTW